MHCPTLLRFLLSLVKVLTLFKPLYHKLQFCFLVLSFAAPGPQNYGLLIWVSCQASGRQCFAPTRLCGDIRPTLEGTPSPATLLPRSLWLAVFLCIRSLCVTHLEFSLHSRPLSVLPEDRNQLTQSWCPQCTPTAWHAQCFISFCPLSSPSNFLISPFVKQPPPELSLYPNSLPAIAISYLSSSLYEICFLFF